MKKILKTIFTILVALIPVIQVSAQCEPAIPQKPNGELAICNNKQYPTYTATTTFSTQSVENATSYQWSINPANAGVINGNTASITISWAGGYNGYVSITVKAVNDCGTSASSEVLEVSVNTTYPSQAVTPIGPEIVCQGAIMDYSTYSSGATRYVWYLTPVEAGTIALMGENIKINWSYSFIGSAKLSVAPHNKCGVGLKSYEKLIKTDSLAPIPSKPTGLTEICYNGQNTIYTTQIIQKAKGYSWSITPDTAGLITAMGSQIEIDWSNDFVGAAEIKVRSLNECGSSLPSEPQMITVVATPTKPALPFGEKNICPNIATEFTTLGSTYASTYLWQLNPDTVGVVSGNLRVTKVFWDREYEGKAYIKVKGVNVCEEGEFSDSLELTIKPIPKSPPIPLGERYLCTNNPNTGYTTRTVALASGYKWFIDPINAGVLTSTDTTATIDWNDTFAGVVTLRAAGLNECGVGIESEPLVIVISQFPDIPPKPVGPTDLCQAQKNAVYTTKGIPFSGYNTEYKWSVSPLSAGTITGNSTTAVVAWSNEYSGGVQIRVNAVNQCGSSPNSTGLALMLRPKPQKPMAPEGNREICANEGSIQYNITHAKDADYYLWRTYPPEAGKSKDQTNIAVVEWNKNFTGLASLYVLGVNYCGEVSSDSLKIYLRPIPKKSGIPTGADAVCINSFNTEYKIGTIEYATYYQWSVFPREAGYFTNTDSITTLNWNDTFSGKVQIMVQGKNDCGVGDTDIPLFATVFLPPEQVSTPIGTDFICQGEEKTNFSIKTEVNSITYEWLLTPLEAGKVVTDGINTSIEWNKQFAGSAELTVRGVNVCKKGRLSPALGITVFPLPDKPLAPDGMNELCKNSASGTYITNPAANAESYTWTVLPTGAGAVSGTGSTITLDWGNSFAGIASISVSGKNKCGIGQISEILKVKVYEIPAADFSYSIVGGWVNFTNKSTGAQSYLWTFGDGATDTVTTPTHLYKSNGNFVVKLKVMNLICGNHETSQSFTITNSAIESIEALNCIGWYPNPVTDVLHIDHSQDCHDEITVSITDLSGKVLYHKAIIEGKTEIPLVLASGVYLIHIQHGEAKMVEKLFVK